MRATLGAGTAAALLIYAAQAQGGSETTLPADPPRTAPAVGWAEGARAFFPASARVGTAPSALPNPENGTDVDEIDVVDAHWMALTMWGEARGDGEAAMRAVGHVIDNRRRSGRHGGHATDTVSEAWQFSCWNPGDPNRAAMETIDRLDEGSDEHRLWLAAQRIAGEILAGESADPTGGALFYHTVAVAPSWSSGIDPAVRIGDHLFFLEARSA
ncbi:cell wall hydrolase [Sphingosinicella terrae]|uniref:cell wall hydrolase n=1 Tax=Sphingosinicella terrae TaxID=2172047 RepID=UPI00254952A8|nr:cell wall hydrolase [Sphingosinicella terrae]